MEQAQATPEWLQYMDAHEREELAALGVRIAPGDDVAEDASQRDAQASWFLRKVHEIDADIARHEATQQHEMRVIEMRYEWLLEPLRFRRRMIADALVALIGRIQFVGKAKSRKLLWGVVGRRLKGGTLVIESEEAVIASAKEKVQHVLDVTVTLDGQTYEVLKELLSTIPGGAQVITGQFEHNATYKISKSRLKEYVATHPGEIEGASISAKADTPYFEAEPPVWNHAAASSIPSTQSEFNG